MCSSDLPLDLGNGEGVVALHSHLSGEGMGAGELTEILNQVEGEAVVVVENQKHGARSMREQAETLQQRRSQQQEGDQQGGKGSHEHGGGGTVFGNAGQGMELTANR